MSSPITITSGRPRARGRAPRGSPRRSRASAPSRGPAAGSSAWGRTRRAAGRRARVLVREGGLVPPARRRASTSRSDVVDAFVVQLAELPEQPLEARERVTSLPLLDEGRVADVGEVRAHRVLHPPERLQLEERRAGSPARARSSARATASSTAEHVVPVDDLAGHPVAGRTVGDVLDRALRPPVRPRARTGCSRR